MKQKPDEVRTLAIKLFEAGQNEKRKQSPIIWGESRDYTWREIGNYEMEVWDAVAMAAYKLLKP